MRISLRIAVVVAILSVVPRPGFATTIDFESLPFVGDPAVDVVDNQFAPDLTFANASLLVAGVTLFEAEFPPQSGGNVVTDFGGPITVTFDPSRVGTSFSGFFTYAVPVTIEAFAGDGSSLGSVTSAFSENFVSSANAPNEQLSLAFPNIAYLTITGSAIGGSFTLDDLSYELADVTGTEVPEPGTLGLALVGVSSLLARRSRRRAR